MSIFRIASFKASYALFLKLVSGAIPTIAISASAMVATPWFVSVWVQPISPRETFVTRILGFIFGIPNARMSSCTCFQRFPLMRCLDNSVSGIPNAITGGLFGGPRQCRGGIGNALAPVGEQARWQGSRTRASVADEKNGRQGGSPMSNSKDAVRKILDRVKADKRTS